MTPATLRARIAASDGSDQGEILEAAYEALLGVKWWQDSRKISYRFKRMFDAEAHTDAALLIAETVLPGWRRLSDGTYEKPRFVVELYPPTSPHDGIPRGAHDCESLAIIDAVCAAVEKGQETT